MRDINRIVIAEDNAEVRSDLRKYLEGVGGFQVWLTGKKEEIMDVLEDSNAYWLILDLELEDGLSKEKIPLIRSVYGNSVFIFILTGYHNIYTENELTDLGADLPLRKPYDPVGFLKQMYKMRDLVLGVGRSIPLHSKLQVEGKILDLDTGDYEDEDGSIVSLSSTQKLLMQTLACSRGGDGEWLPVDRGQVIAAVYGFKGSKYEYDEAKLSGQRLRQLVKSVRKLFTGEEGEDEETENDKAGKHLKVINVSRGSNHTSKYSLDKDVKFISGNRD